MYQSETEFNQNKQVTYGTACQLLLTADLFKVIWRRTRMNIRKLWAEKLDIVLEYQNSQLVMWIHAYRQSRDFEISNFCNFWTSVTLTLDWVIQDTVV